MVDALLIACLSQRHRENQQNHFLAEALCVSADSEGGFVFFA